MSTGTISTTSRINFLLANKMNVSNMPKSYLVEPSFWTSAHEDEPNSDENVAERIIASNGLNIYDGACFQIAAALCGRPEQARDQTNRLFLARAGNITIVARSGPFSYGSEHWKGEKAYFFSNISDTYDHIDPINNNKVNWMDWKPITGENAWAIFIGPIQSLYLMKFDAIVFNDPEIQLAISRLPVVAAMQSSLGGIFYQPNNDHFDCTEVSVENNASMLAGLRLLRQVLVRIGNKLQYIRLIDRIECGILTFLQNFAFDSTTGVFLQGGHVDGTKLKENTEFAVDCQTWLLSIILQREIDQWFGQGTAFNIWQTTKLRAGYSDENGELMGVGYTDGHEVLSSEWTFGAINMCRVLADQYEVGQPEYADSLRADAASMMKGVQTLRVTLADGTEAFKYASKRYYIPFGWWANPVPSTAATAWSIMIDNNFNPFAQSS